MAGGCAGGATGDPQNTDRTSFLRPASSVALLVKVPPSLRYAYLPISRIVLDHIPTRTASLGHSPDQQNLTIWSLYGTFDLYITRFAEIVRAPSMDSSDKKAQLPEGSTPELLYNSQVASERPPIEYTSVSAFFGSSVRRFKSLWTRRFTLSLLAGQLVSLCITCTNVTTTELVNR